MTFRLLFALFLLLFFGYAQADVVAYLLSWVLHRPATPYPWLSALLLCSIFTGIAKIGQRILARKQRFHFPAYLFSGYLAAMLVSIPFVSWRWALGWLLACCAIAFLFQRLERKYEPQPLDRIGKLRHTIYTLCQLLAICLLTGLAAGATDVDHYELRTAQALRTGKPADAYKVGEVAIPTSPRLFALRCYLLATTDKHGLGEAVFQQPVPRGGSKNLLFPADEKQRLIFPADSLYRLLGTAPHADETPTAYLRRAAEAQWKSAGENPQEKPLPAIDYYLTALLLERRLDPFAAEVVRFYPRRSEQGKLPSYFAQALYLYTHSRTQPKVIYHDTAIEANYHDYTEMADTLRNPQTRANLLRRSYGETFWWWYEYDQ